MSYDAGNSYSPKEALDAHRALFPPPGQILLGVQVPPEAWGGHVITQAECADIAAYVRQANGDGMMLWSLQKPGTPSAQQLTTTICTSLALGNCSAPLWP